VTIIDTELHIARLEQLVQELTSERDSLLNQVLEEKQATTTAEAYHQADIDLLSERLIQEANDREWCETYDDVVADINQHLHRPLDTRIASQQLTVRVTLDIRARPGEFPSTDRMARMVHSQLSESLDDLVDDFDIDVQGAWAEWD
jgi:hypothetical protein